MAVRITTKELIGNICVYFGVNPRKETLNAWAKKLEDLPIDRHQELYEKITDTWDRWGDWENIPKRIWATYYSLGVRIHIRATPEDRVGKERFKELADGLAVKLGWER